MKTGRKVTNGPRVYMAGDTVSKDFRYPVIIEVVVEGTGDIALESLAQAVKTASQANPGTRLAAKGYLHATRLVDTGMAPPVRRIDGAGWSGYGSEGLPFYRYPLPLRSGPTCDVILMTGSPARVLFRGHHAVIDGQGLIMWIADVFRVLRGDTPIGSSYVESVDQFRRITRAKEPKWTGGRCVAPTGMPQDRENRIAFSRLELPGPISALMPRLILLTAEAARQHHPTGRIVFGVPVSLRHRKPEVCSSSNLSRAVYVEIIPSTTIADITGAIHRHRQADGRLAFAEAVIPFLPLWVLRRILESGYRKALDTGRYWVSGFASNVGRFETKDFSAPGFTARSIFFLPTTSCSTPVFFIFLGIDDRVSISVSMPGNLASGGRLEALVAYLRRNLCPCPDQTPASGLEGMEKNGRIPDNLSFVPPDMN